MFERYAANAAKPEERPRGNYFAGNCYRLLGRDREAIGAFNKVIEDPAGGLFAAAVESRARPPRRSKPANCEEALALFEEVVAAPAPAESPRRGRAACRAHRHQTRQDRSRRQIPRS